MLPGSWLDQGGRLDLTWILLKRRNICTFWLNLAWIKVVAWILPASCLDLSKKVSRYAHFDWILHGSCLDQGGRLDLARIFLKFMKYVHFDWILPGSRWLPGPCLEQGGRLGLAWILPGSCLDPDGRLALACVLPGSRWSPASCLDPAWIRVVAWILPASKLLDEIQLKHPKT